MNHSWVQYILDSAELRGCVMFRLELETLRSKKDQLDSIVERLQRLEGKSWLQNREINAASPSLNGTASKSVMKDGPNVWHWTGPANINGEDRKVYSGLERLHYHVVVLNWRSVKCDWDPNDRTAVSQPNAGSSVPTRGDSPTIPQAIPERRQMMTRDRDLSEADYAWGTTLGQANGVDLKTLANAEARRLEVLWEAEGSLLKIDK